MPKITLPNRPIKYPATAMCPICNREVMVRGTHFAGHYPVEKPIDRELCPNSSKPIP